MLCSGRVMIKQYKDQKMKQNFDIWIKQQTNTSLSREDSYSAPSLVGIGKIPAIAANKYSTRIVAALASRS